IEEDWNGLFEIFKLNPNVTIGNVNCKQKTNSEICSKAEVRSLPHLAYFTENTGPKGKKYWDVKTKEEMSTFVQNELDVSCDPRLGKEISCSERERKFLENMKSKDIEYLEKQAKRLSNMKFKKLKAEAKFWLYRRLAILNKLISMYTDSNEKNEEAATLTSTRNRLYGGSRQTLETCLRGFCFPCRHQKSAMDHREGECIRKKIIQKNMETRNHDTSAVVVTSQNDRHLPRCVMRILLRE
ncbi:hypothetical protein AAMO2058_001653300, partial [Amorphochlora amoebiformis]